MEKSMTATFHSTVLRAIIHTNSFQSSAIQNINHSPITRFIIDIATRVSSLNQQSHHASHMSEIL